MAGITATGHYSDAPSSPTATGTNLSPLFQGIGAYNPYAAGVQTLKWGIGGAVVAAGSPALAAAAARAIPGPALGALMELSGETGNTYAAENVLTVIETEGYAEFLEGMNKLGEAFKSLEVELTIGP